MLRILLIGWGYHANRIYVPVLDKESEELNAKIVAFVDLEIKKEQIESQKLKFTNKPTSYYISPDAYDDQYRLFTFLDKILACEHVDAVIIATEPLKHLNYAKWALSRNLHILMDKPITTNINVANDINQANKIYSDYLELKTLYLEELKRYPTLIFNLMAQRRFHPGYKYVYEKIKEVTEKTNCPVTSIVSSHSDGMWRLPTEIVSMNYHPYNQGYGKLSHSGYHSLDIGLWFTEAGETVNKQIDTAVISANFVRPSDFLHQININDYKKIFPNFDLENKFPEETYHALFQTFGEIDASCDITLMSNNKKQTIWSLSLMHNGVSQRGWISSEGRNLYKGNGRIRQEFYYICQGPFQSIMLETFQTYEVSPEINENLFEFGEEFHFDIHVTRNDTLFPEWKKLESRSIKDLMDLKMEGKSRGPNEDARRLGIFEFIQCIKNGNTKQSESSILSHNRGTKLLSQLYLSGATETTIKCDFN